MSQLFEPWNIDTLKLNNRIVIAPMCQYSAQEGKATSWHMMHLGTLSHSGAGLLIVEATAVTPEGRISWGDLGLYNDECESALANVVKEIKKYSSMPLAIQLAHAGRKASTEKPWLGGQQIMPNQKNGWQTVAPSALAYSPEEHPPVELSLKDLESVKKSFTDAAQRALRIGFQGIEVHGAHGYLLHQFLSPLSNQRTDQYGGSLENRMRFPLEVFEAIKNVAPAGFPVWMRISATDWIENGWNENEAVIFSAELKKRGCSLIHVSTGGLAPDQKIPVGPNYQAPFAEKIKNEVDIKTIAVGLITNALQAEEIISSQKADAVAIARAILYDTRWPWHAAAELKASVLSPFQFLRSQPHGLNDLLKAEHTSQ